MKLNLMFREGVLGDEFGLDKASWIELQRLNPSGFIRSREWGWGCLLPQDALCHLRTLPERRPSTNMAPLSFTSRTLYKVTFLSYFTIVMEALRETERHPQQASSDRLRSASKLPCLPPLFRSLPPRQPSLVLCLDSSDMASFLNTPIFFL